MQQVAADRDVERRQAAEHPHARRRHPDFLVGLAQRRLFDRLAGLHRAARQRHLSGVVRQPRRPHRQDQPHSAVRGEQQQQRGGRPRLGRRLPGQPAGPRPGRQADLRLDAGQGSRQRRLQVAARGPGASNSLPLLYHPSAGSGTTRRVAVRRSRACARRAANPRRRVHASPSLSFVASSSPPRCSACRHAASAAPPAAPKGHLLIVGGNGTTDDIVKRAVDTAGGAKARMVIFPQASEVAETGAERGQDVDGGGHRPGGRRRPGEAAEAIAAVKDATFIWFPGGDQTRLMKAFEGTGIPEAIRASYEEGALVGGTSAGAAVMSAVMITGDGFDLQAITAGKTDTKPGLGLFPEAIVDQHFLKRQRMNRLISAVLDHPDLVGVGIDETTAIFVTGRSFEVLGKSSVLVIDARKASVDKTPAGELATGRNLVMSVLKAGMTYSLAR